MKKILLLIAFFVSFYTGFGQSAGNDTTKYIWYRYQYGQKHYRLRADSVLMIPTDTTFSKDGIARKGTAIYVGNGTSWTAVTGSGGAVSSVFGRTGDVTALEADYNAFYPLLSGSYNNPSWINQLAWSKITGAPSFLLTSDTAAMLGPYLRSNTAAATYVPYTGANASVNLGAFGLTTDRLVFNQSPTLAGGVGIVRWNDTDGTIEFGMKGGNVTQQVGQELPVRMRNNTGSTILNGEAVYISGSTGSSTIIAKAKADASSTSKATIGLLTEDIANGQSGFVTVFGKVRDINTSALTEGGLVYLSSTVAGGLTSTPPTGDTYPVVIGVCERSHAVNGVIFVHIDKEYVRKYEFDTALNNRLQNITGLVTAGTNVTITGSGTSGSPYVVNSSGGGSADSTYQTVEIGTAQGKIGNLVNQTFSGGSIPSGWTKGSDLTTDYTGGKLNIIGGTYWHGPNTNQNTTPFLSAMQYDTERMPWEKQSGYIDVVPQTKSAGAIIALTHGSNGATFTAKETVAWDLSNGANSGRVALGTDSSITFTTLQDSTEKMSFSTTDSLRLYWEKDGWNVTAGIINKTTGKKTAVKFGQIWNGIGGRYNFVFLKGTYDVTRIKVDANDRTGGVWGIGHSRMSGSGATSEQNRYMNLIFGSNYKYFGVMGMPASSAEFIESGGIGTELYNRAQPSKVIVDLGSNDIADAVRTPAQIKVYIDSLFYPMSRNGVDINILGQFPSNGSGMAAVNILNDSLLSLCNTRGWTFIDIDTALLTQTGGYVKPQYSSDGVHYNDSGNVIIAQKLRAKIGYKIFSEVVADTTYKIKFHGLEDATFKNGYKVLVADNQGRVGTVANQFPTPAQYIQNKYTQDVSTVAQENSQIHLSGPAITNSHFQVQHSSGGRFGFHDGTLTANSGASNLEFTNAGVGAVGYPQVFSTFTGGRTIVFRPLFARSTGPLTISGSDNWLVFQGDAATNVSGARNWAHYTSSANATLTSGNDNFLWNARGLTTGSNNLILAINNTGGTSVTGSLSNSIIIGDLSTQASGDEYGAHEISLSTTQGSTYNHVWLGGRRGSQTSGVFLHSAGNSGTNQAGHPFFYCGSRGTGNGASGIQVFKTWVPGSSGSASHSAQNTELTIATDSIQFDAQAKFNSQVQIKTTTGISAASNYTVTATDHYFELPDLAGQANRTVTLPTNSGTGRVLIIKNKDSDGTNSWAFSVAVKDNTDADVTTLTDDKVYHLLFNGTNWVITMIY